MHFSKFILILALLALMFGQFSLAQHSASHIDHGFSDTIIEVSQVEHDHDHKPEQKKHECPECALTQLLQAALSSGSVILPIAPAINDVVVQAQSIELAAHRYKAHLSRAPPAVFI